MDFTLTSEQLQMQAMARDFARKEIVPVAAHYDHAAEFPTPVVAKARELGLTNMTAPEKYGGIDLKAMDVALVAEELAWGCAGIAVAITLNNLVSDALVCGGSPAQQEEFFAKMADNHGAYALTEPEAGSDAAAIRTAAVKKGDTYVLNGRKTWISHAPQSSFLVVFARTAGPETGHKGISAFVVDSNAPGVSISNPLPKMGQKASSCAEVAFDNVELKANALLGHEGEGFKLAMRVFDRSRPLVASIAVGVCQRCLDESVKYGTERQAFGQSILEFQGVGFKVAEMGMRTQAARLLTREAAWNIDNNKPSPLAAAYAKAFAADTAMWAAVEAVQVHGGYGYSQEYPVEKLMRDAKVLQIYEGTSEIQRTIMVRELTRAARGK